MTSKVITIKCQLRIGLSSTKMIFSEQAIGVSACGRYLWLQIFVVVVVEDKNSD